jgi:hypothetical protein
MPRNQLKSFPTAILRRGMAHFHPSSSSQGTVLARRDDDPPGAAGSSTPPVLPAAEPVRTEPRRAATPVLTAESAGDHTRSALEAVGAPAD